MGLLLLPQITYGVMLRSADALSAPSRALRSARELHVTPGESLLTVVSSTLCLGMHIKKATDCNRLVQ